MYFVGAILLGLGFLGYVVRLYRNYSDKLSRQTFGFSIQYLAMLFGLMLIDHYQFQIIDLIKSIILGGESKLMPVTFVVDPKLPAEVKTITLSYEVYPANDNLTNNS